MEDPITAPALPDGAAATTQSRLATRPATHGARPPVAGLRPRRLLAVGAVAGSVVLAGCGPTPAETPDPGAPSATTAEPGAVPSSSPEPATPGLPPTLGVGGAIGDFGVNAPAQDVIAYLTEVWGAEPAVTDAEVACVTSGLPGRRLVWDGLTVLVRTTDESEGDIDPYIAGWALDATTGEPPVGPLTTTAGLALGDPADAVEQAYPDAEAFDAPDPDVSVWSVGTVDGDHTDDLTVYATDDVVTTIIGGQGCGD
ncbi:hypothetical protein [uncultured Cellulomonas sp.]|uniref:hypothetical protein n=1 Tax=uncultured Cellulomonas sp. TaxID=189682 RepID=UPI00260ECE33|nr:hypothetical protein [uncultured Cellulomonas sp.]